VTPGLKMQPAGMYLRFELVHNFATPCKRERGASQGPGLARPIAVAGFAGQQQGGAGKRRNASANTSADARARTMERRDGHGAPRADPAPWMQRSSPRRHTGHCAPFRSNCYAVGGCFRMNGPSALMDSQPGHWKESGRLYWSCRNEPPLPLTPDEAANQARQSGSGPPGGTEGPFTLV
jgi:hypothetical protein